MCAQSLRFLADESRDFAVVRDLRAHGYDVLAVSEVTQRSDDRELIEQAYREKRVLLTEDKDFGWLVFVSREASAGVILVRFPGDARQTMVQAVRQLVQEQGEQLVSALSLCSPAISASAGTPSKNPSVPKSPRKTAQPVCCQGHRSYKFFILGHCPPLSNSLLSLLRLLWNSPCVLLHDQPCLPALITASGLDVVLPLVRIRSTLGRMSRTFCHTLGRVEATVSNWNLAWTEVP